jgi:hypothetical protein
LSDYGQTDDTGTSSHAALSTVDVQFTHLSPEDQSRIKTWAMQNEPPSGDPS